MEKEIVYFELNNWFVGKDYPNCEPFLSWFRKDSDQPLLKEDWVKENKLCVLYEIVDMSVNYLISAPKMWVKENCPTLLTMHKKFLRSAEQEEDTPIGKLTGSSFVKYTEENIGLHEGSYF